MLIVMILLSFALETHQLSNFSGHRLYNLLPTSNDHLNLIRDLAGQNQFDVWTNPTSIYEAVNIRVPPSHAKQFEEQLELLEYQYDVVVDDIQKWVDQEKEDNPHDGPDDAYKGEFNVGVYHTFGFISAYLEALTVWYPDIASTEVFGRTHEGNPIKAIKIGAAGVEKPVIWIDSAMHAREWVSTAVALYIIDQLTKGYRTDPEITRLVKNFDWYIFPVMNVDGYKHTWTEDRFWRKNRIPSTKPNNDTMCCGADPNRNFATGFGGNGTSDDICSDLYSGPTPFSEAESTALRDGVLSLGKRLKGYFSLHSYSQLLMSPFGYTYEPPPDFEEQMIALDTAAVAIANTHGKWYKHGQIAPTIYQASGSSVDWVYKEAGVKYSFTMELRDKGKYGFILPKTEIIETGEETFAGIKAIVEILEKKLSLTAPEISETQRQSRIRNL